MLHWDLDVGKTDMDLDATGFAPKDTIGGLFEPLGNHPPVGKEEARTAIRLRISRLSPLVSFRKLEGRS